MPDHEHEDHQARAERHARLARTMVQGYHSGADPALAHAVLAVEARLAQIADQLGQLGTR